MALHQQKTTTFIFVLIFSLMALGALLAIIKNNREIKEIEAQTPAAFLPSVKPTPVPKTVMITYTAQGFKPATTTISSGDTVTFINKSNDSFWPVALGYPILHSLFDAKKPIITGQTYSFTFSGTTTFTYLNRLKPSQVGAVIVK